LRIDRLRLNSANEAGDPDPVDDACNRRGAGPIERRIYPAPRAALSLSGLPAGAAFIDVETSDGLKLKGIAIAPESGKPVLLAFHGNGSSARDAVSWLAPALPKGWGLIAAEYRGYSGNPGRPSEAGLAADADAFARYARTLAGGAPVWLFGHSLGGAVALSLAGRTDAKAVVTVGRSPGCATRRPGSRAPSFRMPTTMRMSCPS
jgi:pimeloyl-ACP methyl ester carboxylesterase